MPLTPETLVALSGERRDVRPLDLALSNVLCLPAPDASDAVGRQWLRREVAQALRNLENLERLLP